MKILEIKRLKKTEKEDYTEITFKTWYGKKFKAICITENSCLSTEYAKNGEWIPIRLWSVVKAFIRTNDIIHKY